jgi:hypothetical protein
MSQSISCLKQDNIQEVSKSKMGKGDGGEKKTREKEKTIRK